MYYGQRTNRYDERTEEADKVSVRIAAFLSKEAFIFMHREYVPIQGVCSRISFSVPDIYINECY